MPVEDIEKGHSHLPLREQQRPKEKRRGLLSPLFRLIWKGDYETVWSHKSENAANWASERGNYDPDKKYTPGKPAASGKPVTNPLENHPSSHFDPELSEELQKQFPNITAKESKQFPAFLVNKEELLDLLLFVRDKVSPAYDLPQHMTAIDWPEEEQLELVYVLNSSASGKSVSFHLRVERNEPQVPSTAHIFRGFDWHEREVYELFGVQFTNHPDLRKLLLDSTYSGYPMLKGYTDEEHEFVERPY